MTVDDSSAAAQWLASDLLTAPSPGTDTGLDPALLTAYCRTDYQVSAAEPITMRIGERNAALDGMLTTQDARFGLFISAWNPRSRPLSILENAARHAEMLHELETRGLRWLSAFGADTLGEWPPEESVFVLDATVLLADQLMTEWDQNAVVWVEHGKVPALVLHPRLRRAAVGRDF